MTYVLGLISGSSLDGLDLCLCRFSTDKQEGITFELIKAETIDFTDSLSEQLSRATHFSARELLGLEVSFSEFCAKAVSRFCSGLGVEIDYIASHGHTIYHHPEDGYTLQIGKGSIIAERTGIPCICDFRANDIASGGEGAPVAPIVEQYLYPGYQVYFNLGGIANFSIHHRDQITSIDSCPCNQVLNYLAAELGEKYDDRGLLARKGTVIDALLSDWSRLDYFKRPAPKSMDNSWVQDVFLPILRRHEIEAVDRLATMVEFCAIQLTRDIRSLGSFEEGAKLRGLVTGGGAHNDYLAERLQEHFDEIDLTLEIPDQTTINFKEAILMALMGYLRVQGIPNTIPSVTGASKATVGGAIYIPGA